MVLTTNIADVKAGDLPPSTLQHVSRTLQCQDYIDGFCRKGDLCDLSHRLCVADDIERQSKPPLCTPNHLSLGPRLPTTLLEEDGPGVLSDLGPRHDNDHVEIKDIQILPTADETLSHRSPYMPTKGPNSRHRLPPGQGRLLDTNFRQLRYENIENLIDCCYHASQQLYRLFRSAKSADYDDRNITARGSRYSLFRDVSFEDIIFHPLKGMMFRISYSCPKALRGMCLGVSGHLEEGMLVALIGLTSADLSVTFMEIHQRQSTAAMKQRTGNDLRASIILSIADLKNVSAVRRLLYNAQGLLNENFVLIEFPDVLFAGFRWTLRRLQRQSANDQHLAFHETIAPSVASSSPDVTPPAYAVTNDFTFQLDLLRKSAEIRKTFLTFKPQDLISDDHAAKKAVETLCRETTFDQGQAEALCECLCRGLAFAQGPPGTGKTFLGVGLARVLIASRLPEHRVPILVVCMTNHALDSFLSGLRDAGILGLARIGAQSKEDWTQQFHLRNLSRKMKPTTLERSLRQQIKSQIDGLATEGTSWCEALNSGVLSWPAVREHLLVNHPDILARFTEIEKSDNSKISDIRLARKAGGFAFEFWSCGGDINDIDLLLEQFNTMLGNNNPGYEHDIRETQIRERIYRNINWNAKEVQASSTTKDIWKLTLRDRKRLTEQWRREIELQTVLDRMAELHRRHQWAVSRRRKIDDDIDARVLENVDVIALTTTACAMNWSKLEKLGLKIVICEEAGQVMEAQFLCTLFPTVEHAISIGDPLQLRPQVNEQCLSLETTTGSTYRLDESLMERLMLPNTAVIKPIYSSRLCVQRRMHPEIADLMRSTLYPYLKDHVSTYDHNSVAGLTDRVWWLDHQVAENSQSSNPPTSTSSSNSYEVEMIAGLVNYLVNTNEYAYRDITILTPYNGQLAAFTERLKDVCSLWLSEKDRDALMSDGLLSPEDVPRGTQTNIDISDMLRLATIDNFQGEESKVVILSTVRSNNARRVGFMKTPNRINVACSRARNGFYIVGNANLMRTVPMWNQVIDLLASKRKLGPALRACCSRHPHDITYVQSPDQWKEIPQCQALCHFEFHCGHQCGMKCHAPALHERMGCTKPCERVHTKCKHRCYKPCGQPCGDCTYEDVSIRLDCGHDAVLSCEAVQEGKTKNDVVCKTVTGIESLTCGHKRNTFCSRMHTAPACEEKCNRPLKCGHACEGTCNDCAKIGNHPPCKITCEKEQPCSHKCASRCHDGSSCPPCQQTCRVTCSHGPCHKACNETCDPCVRPCDCKCPHDGPCDSVCALPCMRLPCSEPCTSTLGCGHVCPSLCGERCPTTCDQCQSGKPSEKLQMFLDCGHQFEVEVLDEHVGIRALYQVNDLGHIQAVSAMSDDQVPLLRLQCPTCGRDCSGLRRYAIHDSQNLESTVDKVGGNLDRKISDYIAQVHFLKTELDAKFPIFKKSIKSGPLNGRRNELLIRERCDLLRELQDNITRTRDDVAKPFESAMALLDTFSRDQSSVCKANLSFRLRLDAAYRRCRLVTLAECVKMVKALEGMSQDSEHMAVLVAGVQELTTGQTKQQLTEIATIITECQVRHLKRLECELHLVEACFHMVLHRLGDDDMRHAIADSMLKAKTLCKKFPETAGLLLPVYKIVQRFMSPDGQWIETLDDKDFEEVWWKWPSYQLGAPKQCPNGHLYSNVTWRSCPECGKEVVKPESTPITPLHDQEFMMAMRTMPANFDGNAYRK